MKNTEGNKKVDASTVTDKVAVECPANCISILTLEQ